MVRLVDVNTNDPDSIKFIIKFLRGNTMVFTKELLKSRNVPDIGSITILSEEYIKESKNITQAKLRTSISRSAITFTTGIKILAKQII